MFKLVNSEVRPLTPELAQQFRDMEPSPTERDLSPARIKHLRQKALNGTLITFHWASARLGDRTLRMNGQHSSAMLSELNGSFPDGLKVHVDEYEVDNLHGLALLFRQFDDRKSSRTTGDVSGAYQGLFPALQGIPRAVVKLGVEGIWWYRRKVEGTPEQNGFPTGDNQYDLITQAQYHPFLQWLGDLFSIKTPELKRTPIVGAIYGTHLISDAVAKPFWGAVARGGIEFEENAPQTVLDAWLKDAVANKDKQMQPGQYYQGCIYAWNAHREEKPIKSIKSDVSKGFYDIVG